MDIQTVAIDTIHQDPANVRKHDGKNIDAIKGSLKRFGQQKPIVVNRDGIVIAGNGTLSAAKALGWTEIKIVRTELAGPEATAYAIADNRTAELAEWDDDALAQTLAALQINDDELAELTGFNTNEIEAITGRMIPEQGEWPAITEPKSHSLVIRYTNEDEHILRRFVGDEEASLVDGHFGKKLLERIRKTTSA
jgi:filamentous hemagglutinin family protein